MTAPSDNEEDATTGRTLAAVADWHHKHFVVAWDHYGLAYFPVLVVTLVLMSPVFAVTYLWDRAHGVTFD